MTGTMFTDYIEEISTGGKFLSTIQDVILFE